MRHRGIRLLFSLALGATVAAHSLDASADGSIGLRTFEDGRRLYEAGKYEEARRSFEASFEVQPSPNTRLYIARCHRASGRLASAYGAFRLAAREAQDRIAATGEQRYAPTRASATREADEIEPRVPRVSLKIAGDATDATLKVDGRVVPSAAWPIPFELDPGAHAFELEGPRIETTRTSITVVESDRKELEIIAKRVARGTLVMALASRPMGMAVVMDGKPVDATALFAPREVLAGTHRVEVGAPGYRSFVWEGNVADGARVDLRVVLAMDHGSATTARTTESRGGTPKWLFFATAGASLATLAGGGALVFHASSRDEEEKSKPIADRDSATRDAIRDEATVGSVLLVSGAALAVGTGVLALTTKWSKDSKEKTVVAATLGGVVVGGSF